MENKIGNVRLMQKINRLKILNFIREQNTALRPEISSQTGLSLSSVTNIVTYLMKKNFVVSDGSVVEGRVGRRADLLRFRNDAYNFICVLIEKDGFTVAFTDLKGNILRRKYVEITEGERDSLLQNVVSEINAMTDICGKDTLLSVCIVISALVLKEDIYSAELNWHIDLSRHNLREKLNVEVFVENTSDMRAVWEFKGKTKENKNVLFFDLDGGIGAVHFTGGEANPNTIGEIGHTTVKIDGEPCVCGNSGCLEVMCSVNRIVADCEKFGCINFDDVLNAFYSGDRKVVPSLDMCGEYMGIGLANLVNIFNPEKIVINGGDFLKCGYIIDKAISCLYKRANKLLTKNMAISKVEISKDEIIKGTALFMCDKIFSLEYESDLLD